MTRELFVYWHAEAEMAERAVAAALGFQQQLCSDHPGLVARLYRRHDPARGRLTVMETYAAAGGLDDALQAALAEAGNRAAADWCPGVRHVEVFEAVA